MDTEDKLKNIKEKLLVNKVLIQTLAGDSHIVGQALAKISAMEAAIDADENCVKAFLDQLGKDQLKAVNASTTSHNVDAKIAVLTKLLFTESHDTVQNLENCFKKLRECMILITELAMTRQYYTDGSFAHKNYSQDVYDAK